MITSDRIDESARYSGTFDGTDFVVAVDGDDEDSSLGVRLSGTTAQPIGKSMRLRTRVIGKVHDGKSLLEVG